MPPSARATAKRHDILAAAREVFLDRGFAGTSMDDVAAAAQASKVTVYKHFTSKQELFVAVVTQAIDEAELASRQLVDGLGRSAALEADLREFARRHVGVVTQPHLVRLRRMIIAEAGRFPDLARAWHRAGPERGHAALATQLERLAQRGLLRLPDPLLAAQHLNYLILSVPLNEAMFAVNDRTPRAGLERYADEAVRVFLAAYGVASR